ncbi:hypothetical protein MSG28_011961 [Choristoneura fumiferana]|uniref:Uncharacterized protein n=1 Tax=Choristoneura fumiferana TaxID=7141 RepID=A0ACC0KNB0_CHOFU|nr:hypothetical protein MSG28_011961 [Choristoneura fumiferana]
MEEIIRELRKIRSDLDEQRNTIEKNGERVTEQVTQNINCILEDKFKLIDEKYENLKDKIDNQEKRLYFLEKQARKNNIVFFGIGETETSYSSLEIIIVNFIQEHFSQDLDRRDIQEIKRIGKKGERPRPIIVTFSTLGTKINLFKRRSALKDTIYYITEDYPQNILKKRKELQEQARIEKERGNIVKIKYDKLIIRKTVNNKRMLPTSPEIKTTDRSQLPCLSPNAYIQKPLPKHETYLPSRLVTVEDHDQNPPKDETNPPKNLYVLTYNVKTLSSYERLLELIEALKDIKYDIIGLAETRRTGNKIEEHKNFILCHTGHTPGKYGIGFIIKIYLKNNIESYLGLSERVAILNLKFENTHLSIIQVYAPTAKASDAEIDKFYTTVNRAIEVAYKDYILMGDLNAKIGIPKKEEHIVMKTHGYGDRNERGQRLIDFASEHKLSILNTFFKKKPKNKWTWRSPDGTYKNEIDFILSNRPLLFQNIEVLNINYPSDHRPVRATVTYDTQQKKSRRNYNNYQNTPLNSEEEISKFKEYLNFYISQDQTFAHEITSAQKYYDNLIKLITTSLQNARETQKFKKNSKILSERTLKLLKRRQELQKSKNKTRSTRNEISALYKLVSKYVKKDYTNYRYNTIEKHLSQTGSTKRAFKDLKPNKTWIDGLKRGEITKNNRSDIITIATEFYRELYSAKEPPKDTSYMDQGTSSKIKNLNKSRITESDVVEALNKLKIDKSPGPDNIANETLKIAAPILEVPLTNLFNFVLETGETPAQWSESKIILLYKKGDPNDIGNYRPISLMPSTYKLFSTILNKRISATLEKSQPVEQAGFRKGFSTIDHIHTLELLIEKYQEKNRPLYLAYIDYKKAFDSVSHNYIWETLTTQNVESEYIQVIKSIYNNSKSRVQLETAGSWFPIKRGVRQGDPLSPILFIAALESIINKLDWKERGIKVQNKYLSHLRFADDLVLISEKGTELQYMIESLNNASKLAGLEMNLSKTMIMTNSTKIQIYVDDEPLRYTEQYIYLGKQISFDSSSNYQEVERRAQLTWNKYWGLKEIFKSNMPINLKTKVMNTCLVPCLTYACQTWKFNKNVKDKIMTCQRGIERSMLNIKKIQKIRHIKIRNITKATDGLTQALTLKWKWAGHVARLQDQRWTKCVTAWKGPIGKRKKGRPRNRWEDEIKRTAGLNWMDTAKSREVWLTLEEAFTCRGVLTE